MIADFEAKLREYAHLIVEVGLNLQSGQTPTINAPVACAPLARLCVEAAYDRGARQVICDWSDDFITRETFLRADEAVFSEYPSYLKAKLDWMLERECPRLSFTGYNPELLKGVDMARVKAQRLASTEPTKAYFDAMTASRFQWCVAAYATPEWAMKVFPDKSEEDAVDALWEAIFKTCRVEADGKTVERWHAHIDAMTRRAKLLNDYDFKSLHYTNAAGTDLTVELPENHIWGGGAELSGSGILFAPNLPTEEIFTAPRWDGVNGHVVSSLPLSLDGHLVKGFSMDFENGKIVRVHADEGEEVLKNAISLDEGAAYLGEVALVPYDSPIRNTGLTFSNTLFDENASCHLAFGAAYPTCVKDGDKMGDEERKQAGLNNSMTHVDFMIGTSDLSIAGVTRDGREIPVFVDGGFAF